MAFRAKRLAQRVVVITFSIFYALLLVIWVTSPNGLTNTDHNWDSSNSLDQNSIGFQERAVRSVADNKIDVQKTSQNGNNFNQIKDISFNNSIEEKKKRVKQMRISLNDIFISVKTTKKFHSTRLDIILKTWFNLAKDQVIAAKFWQDHFVV